MSLAGEQVLLRVYLQSADRTPHAPTFERIVKAARSAGLAGATVLRGIMGFGSHGVIHASPWSLVQHVPVIVEFVDAAERITAFLPVLDRHLIGGMATLERANVVMYRHGKDDSPGSLQLGDMIAPRSTVPKIQTTGTRMRIDEDGVLLRVFIGESDRFEGKPLHEAVVQKARELGLAGATVLRGSEGFGANSVVHKAALLEMSSDLPIVIEIVDTEPRVRQLLPHLESMVREGMITMEYVVILIYRHDPNDAPVQRK
jgi:PII-like signaling protein